MGWPSPAEEELVDVLSLDEWLIRHPDQTYLVKVSGRSMMGAGILAGDIVLVERGRKPQNNDIVIAQADGEWMMRSYDMHQGKARLYSADPEEPPLVPLRELVINGVVTAVIRKYK